MNNLAPEALDYRAGQAYRDGDPGKARLILSQARMLHPGQESLWAERLAQIDAKEPRLQVPPAGVHREGGGPTTLSMFGSFERAPDPGPGHPCPECATAQIDEHREQCQGCAVDASTRTGPAAALQHEKPADRSDPDKECARCHVPGAGPGGIICQPCREETGQREPGS